MRPSRTYFSTSAPLMASGLPGGPHHAAKLVQRGLVLRAEGGQHVGQVNGIFAVAIELIASRFRVLDFGGSHKSGGYGT